MTDKGGAMTAEVLEGEVREVEPIRAVVPIEAPEYRLSVAPSPEQMVEMATRMATVLRDVVERQRLYATISGRKYPQVEAWMTIARMDNVVAREVTNGVLRLEDGAYEATVELLRLSDGMVIGRASALCGVKGDKPWDTRGDHHKRSMAVTRATSRAFRQQYSWIMALAGYEPTPAEEMPRDEKPEPSPDFQRDGGGIVGKAEVGTGNADFELRETPEGMVLAFRLVEGRKKLKVIALGPMAETLALMRDATVGQRVTCWGRMAEESFPKDGKTITYPVLILERLHAPEFDVPAAAGGPPSQPVSPDTSEPEHPSLFSPDEDARITAAVEAVEGAWVANEASDAGSRR